MAGQAVGLNGELVLQPALRLDRPQRQLDEGRLDKRIPIDRVVPVARLNRHRRQHRHRQGKHENRFTVSHVDPPQG
jgi:hypothetical protein